MVTSQNKAGGDAPRSISNMSPSDGSWRPSLRKMTKRMFSSKAPTRPTRPELPKEWIDGNHFEPPKSSDPPHTIIAEHPRGSREPLEENIGFIKRTLSKLDKENTYRKVRRHVSKPSIGGSSSTYSATPTDIVSQVARENRYPDTDAETSPSSTIPRDPQTPNRTSYKLKRSTIDFTSNTILLPTVYQPPTDDDNDTDVDINSFPLPPCSSYHTNPNLNQGGKSPIQFQFPIRCISPSISSVPDENDKARGLQRFSIPEQPDTSTSSDLQKAIRERPKSEKQRQTLARGFREVRVVAEYGGSKTYSPTRYTFLLDPEPTTQSEPPKSSGPIRRSRKNYKLAHEPEENDTANPRQFQDTSMTNEQLNNDFQRFLTKSRTQAKSRNTNISSHNFQPEPLSEESSKPSKVLDQIAKKYIIEPPSPEDRPETQSENRSFSFNATPPLPKVEPKIQSGSKPQPQSRRQSVPFMPQLRSQSRFSTETRQANPNNTSMTFYGRVRDFIFPPRRQSISTNHLSNVPLSPGPYDIPRLYVDKDKREEPELEGSSRWSKMGRTVRRNLSLEIGVTDGNGNGGKAHGVGGVLNDREDFRGVEASGRRGSWAVPTSRGWDRYNRTVNGAVWNQTTGDVREE